MISCVNTITLGSIPSSENRFVTSLSTALGEFFQTLFQNSSSPIAIDGKTIKGAKQADGRPIHLLFAFLHKEGVVIAQTIVQNKTNEIPTLPILLVMASFISLKLKISPKAAGQWHSNLIWL